MSLPDRVESVAPDATEWVDAPNSGPEETVIFGVVVLKESGAAVPAARVVFKGRRQDQPGALSDVATTTTDGRGRYELRVAFPEDIAFLDVHALGLAPESFHLDAPPEVGRSHRQDLVLAGIPASRDLRLRLRVRWLAGGAVAGAAVQVGWGTGPTPRSIRAHTGASGDVELTADGLAHDGTVRVTVEARADGPVTATWYPPAGFTALERDFVVPDGLATAVLRAVDVRGQRLDVPTRYRISGMFGERWSVESPSFERSGEIPAAGEARVHVPAPGGYRVSLDCSRGWRRDTDAPGFGELRAVTAGTETVFEMRCEPAKVLAIRITGPSGALAGVLVTVTAVRWSDAYLARSDESGLAEVAVPVRAEWFTVTADTPGYLTSPVLLRHPDPGPVLVPLVAKRGGNCAIIGEIVGGPETAGSSAMFEAQAWVAPHEPGSPPLIWLRSPARTFRMRGLEPSRRYDVCVRTSGWDPVWLRDVAATESGPRVSIGLERPTSTISRGRVVTEDGIPDADGLTVFLQPRDATGLGLVATIRDSRFELACPPGLYRVILADSEYESDAADCSVPGPDVILRVRRTGPPPDRARIAVQVVRAIDGQPIVGAEIAIAEVGAADGDAEEPWIPFATTDESGKASFTLWGGNLGSVGLRVRAESYESGEATAAPPWPAVRVLLKPR